MPYPHSTRIEGFLFKAESTYGVDSVPVAASDGIRGVGRIWPALSSEYAFPNDREDVMSNSLIQVAPGEPRGRVYRFDYTVQLMGAGVEYSDVTPVRPECDPLLMASAMSRVHVNGSSGSVTYSLADTGHGSGTAYIYAGGKLFQLVGVRCTPSWSPTAGGLGQIRFQGSGVVLTTPTEVAVPAITYDTVVPPPGVAMGLAIEPSGGSSWTPRTAGMELVIGHEIEQLDDVNSAEGIEGFFVGATNPRFSFSARAQDLATYNGFAHARSRVSHTIAMTLGSSQWNRVSLAVSNAYLMGDPQPAEDGRFAALQYEYLCRDVSLAFN